MSLFWVQHQAGLILFLAVLVLVAVSNWRGLRPMDQYPPPVAFPFVSILVPVRNEAENIGACLHSLLGQQYPSFEILVLDDDSSDGTGKILETIAAEVQLRRDVKLRIMQGKELPSGWLGKHWSCHQLAHAADGQLLLFTDADTRHHPGALADAVGALMAEDADLLTAVPYEETRTLGEKLIVPILAWSIFSFLPLRLVHRLGRRSFTAAVGQFMLFRRHAYEQLGGYAAVRSHATDDFALARGLVACGGNLRLVDGSRRVRCRMYRSFSQAFAGLSKNLYAAFDYNPWLYGFVWTWLGIVFLEPLAVLALHFAGRPLSILSPQPAATAAALSLLLWAIFCLRFGHPLYQALLYPFTIFLAILIAARSIYLATSGRSHWKDRRLPKYGRS